MVVTAPIPILGLVAFSGTGKTTVLVKIIALLREQGYRVGVVKHAHHTFDIDKPGKDSYVLRKAGAGQTLVGSRHRWALITETPENDEPRLDELVSHLDADALDLVLVEGFKHEVFPKIELHRPGLGHPLLYPDDDAIVAIAVDAPLPVQPPLPVLDLNQPAGLVAFIIDHLSKSGPFVRVTPAADR